MSHLCSRSHPPWFGISPVLPVANSSFLQITPPSLLPQLLRITLLSQLVELSSWTSQPYAHSSSERFPLPTDCIPWVLAYPLFSQIHSFLLAEPRLRNVPLIHTLCSFRQGLFLRQQSAPFGCFGDLIPESSCSHCNAAFRSLPPPPSLNDQKIHSTLAHNVHPIEWGRSVSFSRGYSTSDPSSKIHMCSCPILPLLHTAAIRPFNVVPVLSDSFNNQNIPRIWCPSPHYYRAPPSPAALPWAKERNLCIVWAFQGPLSESEDPGSNPHWERAPGP